MDRQSPSVLVSIATKAHCAELWKLQTVIFENKRCTIQFMDAFRSPTPRPRFAAARGVRSISIPVFPIDRLLTTGARSQFFFSNSFSHPWSILDRTPDMGIDTRWIPRTCVRNISIDEKLTNTRGHSRTFSQLSSIRAREPAGA